MADSESCLSCKVIAVCTFIGIGGYLISVGRGQKTASKYTMFALGSLSASLGIREIFNKTPSNR